jgi:hypothetical protein
LQPVLAVFQAKALQNRRSHGEGAMLVPWFFPVCCGPAKTKRKKPSKQYAVPQAVLPTRRLSDLLKQRLIVKDSEAVYQGEKAFTE